MHYWKNTVQITLKDAVSKDTLYNAVYVYIHFKKLTLKNTL